MVLTLLAECLQDTSLLLRVNGVAGLEALKFLSFFVFCRTFLRLATCDLGLQIPWRCLFLVLSYLLSDIKTALPFLFESFH